MNRDCCAEMADEELPPPIWLIFNILNITFNIIAISVHIRFLLFWLKD